MMRNDQRPYVTVSFAGVKTYVFPGEWDDEDASAPIVTLSIRGRSPALHTKVSMGCAVNNVDAFRKPHSVQPVQDETLAEYSQGTMFPDEKLDVPCEHRVRWVPSHKPGVVIRGVIEYSDFTKHPYKTPFCYVYYSYDNKLSHCPEDDPN
jgi:hypothetical protein